MPIKLEVHPTTGSVIAQAPKSVSLLAIGLSHRGQPRHCTVLGVNLACARPPHTAFCLSCRSYARLAPRDLVEEPSREPEEPDAVFDAERGGGGGASADRSTVKDRPCKATFSSAKQGHVSPAKQVHPRGRKVA